jgi:hypothetical protein
MDGDLSGVRLLLVEDEALIGLWLQDIVDEWGCQVVALASSLEIAKRAAETADNRHRSTGPRPRWSA